MFGMTFLSHLSFNQLFLAMENIINFAKLSFDTNVCSHEIEHLSSISLWIELAANGLHDKIEHIQF